MEEFITDHPSLIRRRKGSLHHRLWRIRLQDRAASLEPVSGASEPALIAHTPSCNLGCYIAQCCSGGRGRKADTFDGTLEKFLRVERGALIRPTGSSESVRSTRNIVGVTVQRGERLDSEFLISNAFCGEKGEHVREYHKVNRGVWGEQSISCMGKEEQYEGIRHDACQRVGKARRPRNDRDVRKE